MWHHGVMCVESVRPKKEDVDDIPGEWIHDDMLIILYVSYKMKFWQFSLAALKECCPLSPPRFSWFCCWKHFGDRFLSSFHNSFEDLPTTHSEVVLSSTWAYSFRPNCATPLKKVFSAGGRVARISSIEASRAQGPRFLWYVMFYGFA